MAAGPGISGIVAYLAITTGFYQQIVGTPLIWIVMLAPLGIGDALDRCRAFFETGQLHPRTAPGFARRRVGCRRTPHRP
jgi:hypothetical protein